jgi:hypothetical protein
MELPNRTERELINEIDEKREEIIASVCAFLRGENHTEEPLIKSAEELQREKDTLQGHPSRHPFIASVVKEKIKSILNISAWDLSLVKHDPGSEKSEDMWALHNKVRGVENIKPNGEAEKPGITMAVIADLEKDFAA